MKLKFVNYTSLLALALSQSSPLLSMVGDESEDKPAASSTVPRENNREAWLDGLFVKKTYHYGSKLILENLKREIIGVSFQALKDRNNLQNSEKQGRLIAIMDQESNNHPEDENLHKFLFNLYSGGLLKNSVFINEPKAGVLLDNACHQKWGWAFWERAKRSPEHIQGKVSRDHYIAVNYNVPAAINYLTSKNSQNLYTRHEAESFYRTILTSNGKCKSFIDEFVKKWTEIGFAQPFLDAIEGFQLLRLTKGLKISAREVMDLEHSFLKHAASLGHPGAISSLAERMHERFKANSRKNLKSQKVLLRELVGQGLPTGIYTLAQIVIDENKEEAINLLLKGAHLGSHSCMERLGAVLRDTHPEEAMEWTRQAADLGNEDALSFLDVHFAQNNSADAEQWFQMRVDMGDPIAMNKLGFMLRDRDPKKSYDLFIKAAELGEPESMNNVGLLLQKSNPEEAISWFKKSAEAGSLLGMNNYAANMQYRNPQEAIKWFLRAANAGDSLAMFNLYLMLEGNKPEEAREWLLKSAQAHNIRGMIAFGCLIEKENPGAAKDWLFKVIKIDEKNIDATHSLADMYYKEKNIPEAIKWYRIAADLNYAPAMFNLGVLLQYTNYEEAVGWAQKSIDLGYVDAMNLMGCLLIGNQPQESEKYFLMAAERGCKDAMNNLGLRLKDKRPKEAKRWLLKAALLDDVNAMGSLGYALLQEGNLDDALFWIEKAAGLGNEKSKKLLSLCRLFSNSFGEASNDSEPIIQNEERPQDIDQVFDAFEAQNLSSVAISPSPGPKPLTENQKSLEIPSSDDEADETSSSDPVETAEALDLIEAGLPQDEALIEVAPKKEDIKNPKTRREMAKALARHRMQIGDAAQEVLRLLDSSQILVNEILSKDSDHIQKESLKRLFSDPYFSNQVRVIDTKSGFTVIAHHRAKNEHRTTGAHRKHGKEKYTGRIHPETLKDVKEILNLFDVVKK